MLLVTRRVVPGPISGSGNAEDEVGIRRQQTCVLCGSTSAKTGSSVTSHDLHRRVNRLAGYGISHVPVKPASLRANVDGDVNRFVKIRRNSSHSLALWVVETR